MNSNGVGHVGHHPRVRMTKARVMAGILAMVAAGAGAGTAPGPGGDAALKARVREEYSRALARLEEQFAHFKGSGLVVLTDGKGLAHPSVETFDIEYAREGDYRLYKSIRREAGKDVTFGTAFCVTPEASFILRRKVKDGPFVIDSHAAGPSKNLSGTINYFGEQWFFAPFSLAGVPLSKIMADPGFSVRQVTQVAEGGRDLIKIDFDLKSTAFHLGPGWLLVDPEAGWALRKFESRVGTRADAILKGTVDYGTSEADSPRGAIPNPASVVLDHPNYINKFTCDQFKAGPIPLKAYRLPAFGLPDLSAPGPSGRNFNVAYLFFGGAAVALAVAVALSRYGNRLSAA